MSQLVVVGSINMDLVVQAPRMPHPGETLTGYDFHTIPGGKGANQAVAAARQGAVVKMIGSVGADDFGRQQQHCLGQDRVDLSLLTIDPTHSTGVALITVDTCGQNTIVVVPGANGSVSPQQIEQAKEAIITADMLICQLEVPLAAVTRAIDIAADHHVPVLLNPAPACAIAPSVLQKVTYLIPNENEAHFLSGIAINDLEDAQHAAMQLRQFGPQTIILTLGANGALIAQGEEYQHVPALRVKAVDTTAAGDAFVASFAVALTEGKNLHDAVTWAMHAAALSVTKIGAQSSLPTRAEVEHFLVQTDS